MAKRFLDKLAGDAYEEDVLVELIPTKRKPRRPKNKKSFLSSIEKNINPAKPSKSANKKATRKKSFLDTIEEALDSNAFDDVIPATPSWKRREGKKEVIKVESRFSTMITTEVLERARQIAERKGIRIKDVINVALQRYIEDVEV